MIVVLQTCCVFLDYHSFGIDGFDQFCGGLFRFWRLLLLHDFHDFHFQVFVRFNIVIRLLEVILRGYLVLGDCFVFVDTFADGDEDFFGRRFRDGVQADLFTGILLSLSKKGRFTYVLRRNLIGNSAIAFLGGLLV